MPEVIYHRGYKILANSKKNEQGKWIPEATITPVDETTNQEQIPLAWSNEFDTCNEADDFAAEGAEFYIDEQY